MLSGVLCYVCMVGSTARKCVRNAHVLTFFPHQGPFLSSLVLSYFSLSISLFRTLSQTNICVVHCRARVIVISRARRSSWERNPRARTRTPLVSGSPTRGEGSRYVQQKKTYWKTITERCWLTIHIHSNTKNMCENVCMGFLFVFFFLFQFSTASIESNRANKREKKNGV